MPTDLRRDPDFLKRLLTHAFKLHSPGSPKEAIMVMDIREYLMYLTLDALADKDLAETLVPTFNGTVNWLQAVVQDMKERGLNPIVPSFYADLLDALEQLLCLRHEIKLVPRWKISRVDFMESWKRTAEELGLDRP